VERASETVDVRLERDGVALRPWEAADADVLATRLNGDRAITEFLDRIPQPYTRDDALAYIRHCAEAWRTGSNSNFAILVEDISGPVGSVGIRWKHDAVAEIGYWLAESARGRGVTTTAARLVSRWAFDVDPELARLQLRADATNAASNRVAEKAGFIREGVLRSANYNSRLERRVDWVVWSLLRDEL
jgi:RimJ/RimL family protein N-acetyltransferase